MAFHNLGLGANVGVKADIGADLQESRFLKLQILRALAAKQFPFATYVSHTGTRTIVECRQCGAGPTARYSVFYPEASWTQTFNWYSTTEYHTRP